MFNENIGKDIRALAFEKSIDVEKVFSSLMVASRDRHLPAFERCAN